MSFLAELESLPLAALLDRARMASPDDVRESLGNPRPSLADFANLISLAAGGMIEDLARRSQALTRQRFGKVVRLFAPVYVSNECVNNCRYCGFSRDVPIVRLTLSVDEVLRETRALIALGFRNLLLVAGEHPKFIPVEYLAECVRALHQEVPSISLEIGPQTVDDYRTLVEAGADGLVIYQETYDRRKYAELHLAGPKRDFQWRLETPERACAAGLRRIGIGALLGLHDWRSEAICMAAHASYLLRHCWKSFLTISLPRLRPCAGRFEPPSPVSDRDLAQMLCALRLFLPDAGIVLSTREPARLRDGLIPLGVTLVSAGSHTEPGGYTGTGRDKLHLTERGRAVELADGASDLASCPSGATAQFEIADERTPQEVSDLIRRLGYEPVWKDWDAALSA